MKAIQDPAMPVPKTILHCDDRSVIGSPFELISFVTGEVVRTQTDLCALSDETLRTVLEESLRLHALLHWPSYQTLGLSDFGRPDGFVMREIRGWHQRWDFVAAQEPVDIDRPYAVVDESPSQTQSAVVHGDFRVDKPLLDLDSNRVVALVDRETVTLGDPLTDVATMCTYQCPSFDHVVAEQAPSNSQCSHEAHARTQRYAELTRTDLRGFHGYRVLALFKLAAIAEGFAARHRSGVGNGPAFESSQNAVLLSAGPAGRATQR
jgi:aminoglycoside phosphotransferase (APT) family kinase protein